MAISKSAPIQKSLTRRQFLYTTALAGAAAVTYGAPAARKLSSTDKLNIAAVGCGGQGDSDIDHCSGENIVALCDVNLHPANGHKRKHPNAKVYQDWRIMLEKEEKNIDAVLVSTPDHMHALLAATAMRMGKHVYCQKPLVQTVYEARLMRDLAKEHGVATQMGNQGSSEDGLRRAVEVVHAGLIGPVRQVHVWSNRPIWPQGMARPAGEDTVPEGFNWDLWLGPAPLRPYKGEWSENGNSGGGGGRKNNRRGNVYQPFNWRGWQDFGTGALGDMACHTCNMAFRALSLGFPTEIEASSSAINKESYPLKSKIRFEFPKRKGPKGEDLVPATFWWYDGGNPLPDNPFRHDGNNKPPKDIVSPVEEMMGSVPGSGCILVGDKGVIFSPDDYGAKFFLKMKDEKSFTESGKHDAVKAIPQSIPRNEFQGEADKRQHLEWIAACKGGKPGYSNFDIAAYLTEIILLGCVALRTGKKLEWDGPNMKAKNAPEAAQFVKRTNRKGWEA